MQQGPNKQNTGKELPSAPPGQGDALMKETEVSMEP